MVSSGSSRTLSSSTRLTPHRHTSPAMMVRASGSRLAPSQGPERQVPLSMSNSARWRLQAMRARSAVRKPPELMLSQVPVVRAHVHIAYIFPRALADDEDGKGTRLAILVARKRLKAFASPGLIASRWQMA